MEQNGRSEPLSTPEANVVILLMWLIYLAREAQKENKENSPLHTATVIRISSLLAPSIGLKTVSTVFH